MLHLNSHGPETEHSFYHKDTFHANLSIYPLTRPLLNSFVSHLTIYFHLSAKYLKTSRLTSITKASIFSCVGSNSAPVNSFRCIIPTAVGYKSFTLTVWSQQTRNIPCLSTKWDIYMKTGQTVCYCFASHIRVIAALFVLLFLVLP